MGMFDNIVFDEFTLLEGEQAEKYKDEKEWQKAKEYGKTWNKNIRVANKLNKNKIDTKIASDKVTDESIKRGKPLNKDQYFAAVDGMERHDRRHSSKKQKVAESMIAAYESEFAY